MVYIYTYFSQNAKHSMAAMLGLRGAWANELLLICMCVEGGYNHVCIIMCIIILVTQETQIYIIKKFSVRNGYRNAI